MLPHGVIPILVHAFSLQFLSGVDFGTQRHLHKKLLSNCAHTPLVRMGVVRSKQILCCDLWVQSQHRPSIDHVMIGNIVHLRYLVNDVLQVDHGIVRTRGLRGHERIIRICYAFFSIITGQPSKSGNHQHHNWLRRHGLHFLNIIGVILNKSILGEFPTQCVATTESHKDYMR